MARPRSEGVGLPEGVQVVRKANGRAYYYWAPGRGTARATKPVALGSDPSSSVFWAALERLRGGEDKPEAGTFDALICAFRAGPEWARLRPRSKTDYGYYLDRISKAAGNRSVALLSKRDLYDWRNHLAGTPTTANHMLSILSVLLEFSVENNYRDDNPAIGVKRLKHEPDGTKPWPEEGWRYVMQNAPTDIRRMAILGRACGQRISDLVRMRPADRHRDGFNLRISKLRDKLHFVPLTQSELVEIDSWSVGKLDLYLKTRLNKPFTQARMNSHWNRWRGQQPALAGMEMKVHGLRATAVCDRRLAGMGHQEISNELCMSLQRVMSYSKHIDQEMLARASRDRRERSMPADLGARRGANGNPTL